MIIIIGTIIAIIVVIILMARANSSEMREEDYDPENRLPMCDCENTKRAREGTDLSQYDDWHYFDDCE